MQDDPTPKEIEEWREAVAKERKRLFECPMVCPALKEMIE